MLMNAASIAEVRITMKLNRITLALALFLTLSIPPAHAANKDIIELQTQVDPIAAADDRDEAVVRRAHGRDEEPAGAEHRRSNKVSEAIGELQASINKQQQDRAGQVDQISGQIQALNDTMDELKVRLAKLSKQFEDMQAAQQSMAAQQAQAQQQAQAIAQAPAPDVLYNNALRDYNGAKNDVATQEFNDYIKFYPNTDLAGNAYFYLAEIQYKAGDYQKAVANYDLVLQNFPSGNKAAAAQLKKGFALLELGKADEGTQELKHVIQRYPRTNEATQARERLRKLGPAPKNR